MIRVHLRVNIRVDFRIDFRVNFENGGKENSEKEKEMKRIRPNGLRFLNLQVEKRLLPNFEPNRS